MPGMAFLDSLPCLGLFLHCILPGFISQDPTMLEHSLEGFPLLGITMCMLHACCYLSVFFARVYCGEQGWVHAGMCIYAACTHLYVWCHCACA